MRPRTLGGLLFGAGSAAAAAVIGSLASRRSPQVYEQLDKPSWAPPAGVFGPVWSVLYVMIGVAGWRLWTRNAGPAAIGLHLTQLSLNAAWPIAFFIARDRVAALAVIVALDIALTAEIAVAARRDPPAALLLAPYLGWTLYATALTAAVGDPNMAG